jgi:ATP-binding cassette subfamily B protein
VRELAVAWRDAGARAWTAAIAGLLAGLAESTVLVLAIAAAVRLSDGQVDPISLPFGLTDASAGSLVGIGLAFAAVRLGAAVVGLHQSTAARSHQEARYQRQLLRAHLEASWPEVTSRPEGELQELMAGQAGVAANAVLHATRAVQGGAAFACMVLASLAVDPGVAALTIVGAGVVGVGLRPLARLAASRARRRLSDDLAAATLATESVRLAEELAVFGVGGAQADRGDVVLDRKRRVSVGADVAAELTPVVYQGVVLLLVLLALGALVAADVRLAPTFGAVLVLLLRAFAYSQQAQAAYAATLVAAPRREAVLAATAALAASRPATGDRPLPSLSACDLVGVGYVYPDGRRALDGIDLRVRTGEVLGVAGPSGAGKSTLVQVLLRLRPPTEGRHLVDGRPVEEVDASAWAAAVGLVPQEPKLIEGSVRDNVRFLRPWLTDEQLERAARSAGLDDELWGPSGGTERLVGSRTRALSGGQRQRVAIARALAGDPKLLVLDEPTSALDLECERVIHETVVGLDDSVAVVVVTHRATTLRHCDRIVLLRDGRIEADGDPGELMRLGGPVGAALREINAG